MTVRVLLLFVLALASPAQAQERPPGDDPLPSLDELLGLEESGDQSGDERHEQELKRELSAEELGDAFVQAVSLMGETAARLNAQNDSGIITQRLQEDIIRKLDILIASANKQQQQQSSSSSSSSQSQSQPDQPQQQQQQDPGNSDNTGQVTSPGRQDGPINRLAPSAAAWGGLPARLRDALSQGSSDTFSATYRALTEAYYRKLAEEARK